jgi:hypothetical protein
MPQSVTPIFSRRGAAVKAAASFAEQLLNSPGQSTDGDDGGSPFKEPSRAKPKVKVKYGGKAKARASPRAGETPRMSLKKSISAPVVASSRTNSKKRQLAHSISDSGGELSDITPLSSPTRTPSPSTSRPKQPAKPFPFPSLSEKLNSSTPIKKPTWQLGTLGTLVWVLLDKDGNVFNPSGNSKKPAGLMWWPAKVDKMSSSDLPIRVILFGDIVPELGNPVGIAKPSEKNIRSFTDAEGHERFTPLTFISSRLPGDVNASPRKRQRRDSSDLVNRWEAAVKLLRTEYEDEDDELPDVATAYSKAMRNNLKKKVEKVATKRSRRKANSESDSPSDSDGSILEDRWSPPPCDDMLSIPGELVLAREGKAGKTYWPARILSYVPPKNRKQEPKYQVIYLDDIRSELQRDWFYTSNEPGFGTCKLGEFKSAFNDHEVEDDASASSHDDVTQDWKRGPSPEPVHPPPDNFADLPLRTQFAYVKPVLRAVLADTYAPARARHAAFMKGGNARRSVGETAGQRGQMSVEDVGEVERNVRIWVLRDERQAKFVADDGEPPLAGEISNNIVMDHPRLQDDSMGSLSPLSPTEVSSSPPEPPSSSFRSDLPVSSPLTTESSMSDASATSEMLQKADVALSKLPQNDTTLDENRYKPPPRLRGCDAFEALSPIEKIQYCTNVLHPEAILQLLLWRAGERTSIEVLGADEEKLLHERGEALMAETDWVFDVMRLRSSKVRNLAKNSKTVEMDIIGGTRTRPRRGTGLP